MYLIAEQSVSMCNPIKFGNTISSSRNAIKYRLVELKLSMLNV